MEGSRVRCPLTSVKSHQAHGDAQIKEWLHSDTLVQPGTEQGGQGPSKISPGHSELLTNDISYCGCPSGRKSDGDL